MSIRVKRFVVLALVFSVLSTGVGLGFRSAAWAAGESMVLDEIATFVLRDTQPGASLIRRLTGITAVEVTDVSYRSFMNRMGWVQSQSLRGEVQSELARIQTSFEAYRTQQNRSPKLGAGEALTADEREFLAKAAESLRGNSIENALKESIVFVDAYAGPHARPAGAAASSEEGSFETNSRAFADDYLSPPEGEVPARVDPAAPAFGEGGNVDLRKLQLTWWRKVIMRFRAYRSFAKSFVLSEGQWRSLFTQSGKRFTRWDLVKIRKWNHMLDVISPYGEMRLVVRAFANEPAPVVNRLFELTSDAGKEFAQGLETVDAYVNKLKSVATSQGLPLNDIVWEAQRRMLNVLDRCRVLGGRINGGTLEGGEIALAEKRVSDAQVRIKEIAAKIEADKEAGHSRALLMHTADLDSWNEILDLRVKDLNAKYFEFVQNRSQIEIFANLRNGKVNSEAVAAYDMPDIFVVSQAQLAAWQPVFDTALYNSTNELVLGELTRTAQAKVGATRSVIRGLNKMTEQVVGRQFTDTDYGREFEQYAQHRVVAGLIKMGKILGIAIPATIAEQIGKTQVEKVIHNMTTEDNTSTGNPGHGSSPARGSGGGPIGTTPSPSHAAPTGGAAPAVHPATAAPVSGGSSAPAPVAAPARPRPNPNPNPSVPSEPIEERYFGP
jgi:hypothetical protein